MYFIQTDDQVNIAVEDINPRAQNSILFIHGWPLSHKIFEYQTNILPFCGYRVISIDLRGFGQSDTPAEGYWYDSLADDVYAIICALKPRNLTLAGFSMGGAVAIRYMSRYGGFGVRKLALIAAAAPSFTKRPDYPYGMTRAAVDELIQAAYQDRPHMVAWFGEKLFAQPHSGSIKTWFKDISFQASGIGTIETAKSLRDEDLRSEMSKVTVPTAIFHGKLDQVCPYEFGLLQNQAISDSKLYAFENSGHAVFYEEMEQFNQMLLDFLQS